LILLSLFVLNVSAQDGDSNQANPDDTAQMTADAGAADAAGDESGADLENGKALFKAQCASCHNPLKDATGPKLKGVTEIWESYGDYQGKSGREWLTIWIINWNEAVDAGYPRALEIKDWSPTQMNVFTGKLSDQDVTDILAYVENYELPAPVTADGGDGTTSGADTSLFRSLLIILAVLLLIVAIILSRTSSVLDRMVKEKRGEFVPDPVPLWKNKKLITVLVLAVVVFVGYTVVDNAVSLGRQQGYQPAQPIAFSHALHAGKWGIDCQYCHHAANESKHSNIPSVNICMNCHKAINVGPQYGKSEISKIYASIGYNPLANAYFEDYANMDKEAVMASFREWFEAGIDTASLSPAEVKNLPSKVEDQLSGISGHINKPIEWVRIHNLPDHVYFNHSQHVNVGNIECQTCHGPIEEMDKVYQWAPLSMGWCVNCHRETEVNFANNGYYSDTLASSEYRMYESYHNDIMNELRDKVTVEDIGGTECQKCHY
jgi:mono/diheme cytochrome c family protein